MAEAITGERTSEGVAEVLRKAILDGDLEPGQALRERALAEQLGVSRTPVRESLFILAGEGLVNLTPNRGATVRSMTATEVSEIYSLRALLESFGAGTAASHLTSGDLEALEEAYAELERVVVTGDGTQQANADLRFHSLIVRAARNQLLETITQQVLRFTVTYRSRYKYSPQQTGVANRQHRAILDALRERDGGRAQRLMVEHVTWSQGVALTHYSDETTL